MSEPTYEITLWPNLRSTRNGKRISVTWAELCDRLSLRCDFAGADEHPGWSAATFKDGHRCVESVEQISMLVYDFDESESLERDLDEMGLDCKGFLHTTRRHAPEKPRYRLIFPFSRPVTPEEYARLWLFYANNCPEFFAVPADESTKDPSRFWYLPGTSTGHFECQKLDLNTYDVIDVDYILNSREMGWFEKRQQKKSTTPTESQPAAKSRINGKRPHITRFEAVNAIDPAEVVDALRIPRDGKKFKCPSCGEGLKRTDCAVVRGGTKCSHNRCSGQGKKPGFRTNTDLVMLVLKTDETGAVEWLEERFNIEVPKPKGTNGHHFDAPPLWTDADDAERIAIQEADGIAIDNVVSEYESKPPAPEKPTSSEPIRGLKHLCKVAVYGRTRFAALASEPVNYIWQDIVVAATITLVAGPPAEGKTTLLFLIIAARLGHESVNLLGHELQPAPEGQYVVLIEGEHGEASAARKLVKSFQLLGMDDSGLDRLILIARKAVRLGSPEWRDIETLISVGLVSDIAIDTIARVAPANPDSEAEQVEIFDTVAQAIDRAPEDLKPTAWAIAHTRKNSTGGLSDVSGSAQRTGQADSVLMLKADKSSGNVASVEVTFEKLREAPDEYPEPATFMIGKDVNGNPSLEQGLAGPVVADDRPLEQRILDLLAVEPRTKSALRTKLGRNMKDIDDAITALFSARRIITTTVQIRGNSYKAFDLTTAKSNPYSNPDLRIVS